MPDNAAQKKTLPAVWSQLGVRCNGENQKLAQDHRMTLIEDTCIMVDHRALFKTDKD